MIKFQHYRKSAVLPTSLKVEGKKRPPKEQPVPLNRAVINLLFTAAALNPGTYPTQADVPSSKVKMK